MPLSHKISPPSSSSQYDGKLLDCTAALRPLIADLATLKPDALVSALNGQIKDQFALIAREAEAAGWEHDEVHAALVNLAHEFEGAKGALFD